MKKLKLLLAFCALLLGWSNASAQTDVTASYIGDVTWIVNGGGHNCTNQHKESDGKGWWNSQSIPASWHAFAAPNGSGGAGESWSGKSGGEGMMMGRTMVLPAGNYTLSFDAFGCTSTNGQYPSTPSSAGDVVAYLTGETPIDITNTTNGGNTFHNVSFTFDVAADNTAFEFGIKKAVGNSTADWCQIKNVSLVLNSTDIFPVANNTVSGFTYSLEGSGDTWHTNTWSTEGQYDGSRFQVPFHELWKASGGKLLNADITASHTPTKTGVYKVSAWVRVVNESGGAVNGVNIFVGDTETNACSGSPVINGKGRLGTYTAMADGVEGSPFNFGFHIKNSDANWLSFKNVTITYLGDLPQSEIDALLAQVPSGKMSATIQSTLNTKVNDLNTNKSVAAYNALASYIAIANASINDYADLNAAIAKASSYTPLTNVSTYSGAIAAAQAIYDDASVEDCSETINGLTTAKQTANVGDYTYVKENFQYAVSLGTWTTDNAGEMSGQHWDGTTGDGASTYNEQAEGWGNGNWNCSYSQDLALPAGNYVFKVAGRRSVDATLTLKVTKGNEVLGLVNDFPAGDTGKGITTAGVASFDDGDFANDGAGRGWQWRFVKFTLADPATVNVAVTGAATLKYNWVGFCNATVQTDDQDNVELMEALVALNSAKAAATLTKRTANVGTGVFQVSQTENESLWGDYSTAKSNAEAYELTSSSTVSEVTTVTSALTTAQTAYSDFLANPTLNAPDAEKRYVLTLDGKGALTFKTASTEGGYGMPFMTANVNLAQAFMFEAVSGNTYKMYFYDLDGDKRYICTRADYGSGGTGTYGIRTATDKSLEILMQATATEGVFNMLNTQCDNKKLGSNGGDFYTDDAYTNWTIAEAAQAEVAINIASDVKYATRIFPFTPVLPSGVVAYSCASADGDVLNLGDPVAAPAANTPYILYAENGYTGDALTGWGTAAATTATAGLLTGVYVETPAPVGSYVLQNNSKVGFYVVAESKQPTVDANRCYLTDGNNARAAFFFRGDITGVANVEAATEATLKDGKYLENGKIVIVKNGVKYNAAGAKLY